MEYVLLPTVFFFPLLLVPFGVGGVSFLRDDGFVLAA